MKIYGAALGAAEGPHIELFKQAGFEYIPLSDDLQLALNPGLIAEHASDAVAIVAGSECYTPEILKAIPNLRVISRIGVGYDQVDLAACDERKIAVTITPGTVTGSVVEMTLAMMLGVARGFPRVDQDVRAGHWRRICPKRLAASTLGIVGLGRIGQAVATASLALGMKVIAFDPYPNEEFVKQHGIEMVELNELFSRSYVVTLHCLMTPENHNLINAKTLAMMQPGSILINAARGAAIDEAALYDALKSGHLGGAGLDVFQTEPLPLESPLLEFDNVLLAGHLAGLDDYSHHDTYKMAAENIISLHKGELPAGCVMNLKGVSDWSW